MVLFSLDSFSAHARLFCFVSASVCATLPAHAEVRFGKNVFIGGHDVSHQTFNRQRRGEYYLYEGRPAHPGCAWRSNVDGSRTKVCHLQRKR